VQKASLGWSATGQKLLESPAVDGAKMAKGCAAAGAKRLDGWPPKLIGGELPTASRRPAP
jgi:hypothetical protein